MGARVIGKLSTVRVRQAERRGLYGDGGGLFLQVRKSGARSWVSRFREAGRRRRPGPGPDRADFGLGRNARIPERRESRAVAWPSRKPAAEEIEGPPDRAPCGSILCRNRRIPC